MRCPGDGLALADGHALMVTSEPYKRHIANAVDRRKVSSLLIDDYIH